MKMIGRNRSVRLITYILLLLSISIVIWFNDFWNSTHYVVNRFSLVLAGVAFLYAMTRKDRRIVLAVGTLLYLFSFSYFVSNGVLSFSNPFYTSFYYVITALMAYMNTIHEEGMIWRKKENVRQAIEAVGMAFLTAFLLWGLKIYQIHLNRGNIVCIGVCMGLVVWSGDFITLIGRTFLKLSDWFSKLKTGEENAKPTIGKLKKWHIFAVCFLIIFVTEIIVSILFYPGVLSPDNYSSYYGALHLDDPESRTDIHSFAFVLLFRLILSISQNYYGITFLFVLTFSLIWAYWMAYLFENGASPIIVFGLSIIWVIMPTNQYLLVTTWKDAPFTQSMMLLTLMLARLVIGNAFTIKHHIILGLSIIGTALFRSNGQVVALACVAEIVVYALKKRIDRKILVSAMLVAVFIILIKIPIYKALNVTGSPSGFAGLPFLDAVWFNIHSGNELHDEALEFAEDFMPISEWEAGYTDGQLSTSALHMKDWDDIDFTKAANAYLWCFKHYPITTIWARFNRTYNLWGVIPDVQIPVSQNLVLTNYGSEEYSFDFIEKFSHQRELMIAGHLDNYPAGAFCLIMNRSGTWLLLWLILFWIFRSARKFYLLSLPAFVNTVTLMMGCCYQDYRYSYPAVICSVLGIVLLLTVISGKEERLAWMKGNYK